MGLGLRLGFGLGVVTCSSATDSNMTTAFGSPRISVMWCRISSSFSSSKSWRGLGSGLGPGSRLGSGLGLELGYPSADLLLAARLHDEVVAVDVAIGLDAALEHVHALAVDGVEDLVQHARVVRADDLEDDVAVRVRVRVRG